VTLSIIPKTVSTELMMSTFLGINPFAKEAEMFNPLLFVAVRTTGNSSVFTMFVFVCLACKELNFD